MTRLEELSAAADKYGQTSLKLLQTIKRLGDEIIPAMARFLGPGAQVHGVPPRGDWTPKEYGDGKFTRFGKILISTYEMGVAVHVPYVQEEGGFWIRTVIAFTPEAGEMLVGPTGTKRARLSFDPTPADVEHVCQLIYDDLIEDFGDPVRMATAAGQMRIGFLPN